MVDSSEELDPLFSYTRVQPYIVSLEDDDSDTSPSPTTKRRKTEDSETADNEEDWLPSPPKDTPDLQNQPVESSIIKELRSKKQELELLRKSAGDVIRAIEESAPDSPELLVLSPPKGDNERAKIVISLQDKDGAKKFRVFKDDMLEQLFSRYAEKIKCDIKKLNFCFDGDKISPAETPISLGMEDDDIIEVHMNL